MEAPSSQAAPPNPRARRVTRLVYGAYIALLSTFVVSNIGQVVRVLFLEPQGRGARAITAEPCRGGLEKVAGRLEEATAQAAAARDADAAEVLYRQKRAELDKDGLWAETERVCASEPNGPEALAAMARLDRAAQSTARLRGQALARVRREVDSFIR